jgi:hypothetical protein
MTPCGAEPEYRGAMGSDAADADLWEEIRARLVGGDPVPEKVLDDAYRTFRQRGSTVHGAPADAGEPASDGA